MRASVRVVDLSPSPLAFGCVWQALPLASYQWPPPVFSFLVSIAIVSSFLDPAGHDKTDGVF